MKVVFTDIFDERINLSIKYENKNICTNVTTHILYKVYGGN